MSATPANPANSRSDQRIPKLRTRGRANRQKLLEEAQRLIEMHGRRPIRFSEVFEAAGVSRGSAYRIYNGIDDLMQDMATSWLNSFVAFLKGVQPTGQPENWAELSDQIIARGAAYWIDTSDTLRVLPRVRTNAPESYRAAIVSLTKALSEIFDDYFVLPEMPDWMSTLAMYTTLCDTMFTDVVRREGRISDQRLAEAQIICKTYLSFSLPTMLPARSNHS